MLAAAPTEKDANPKLFHNRPPQLLAEKLQQRAVEFGGLFDLRDVAALFKHHQLGPP